MGKSRARLRCSGIEGEDRDPEGQRREFAGGMVIGRFTSSASNRVSSLLPTTNFAVEMGFTIQASL